MAKSGRPRKYDPQADEICQLIDSGSSDQAIEAIQKTSLELPDGDARTPLVNAAIAGNLPVVRWLLECGANGNAQDRNGFTALHFAVQEKHAQVIRLLLDHDVDVTLKDSYGNAPLWRAVFDARGDYEIVRMLLPHGVDPLAKNDSDRSPMDFAETIGDEDLRALLASI